MFTTHLVNFKFKPQIRHLLKSLPLGSEAWSIGSQVRHNCAFRTLEKQGSMHRPEDRDIFLVVKNKMRARLGVLLLKKIKHVAKPMNIKDVDLFLVTTSGDFTLARDIVTNNGQTKSLTLHQHQTGNGMNWRLINPTTAKFAYATKFCPPANLGSQVLIHKKRSFHGKRVCL